MGSYAGSSDWDTLPARSSFQAFKPRAAGERAPAASATRRAAPTDAGGAADEEREPALDTAGAPSARKRLNAIFAFDTTGSMTPWVENVQEKMAYLAVGLLRLLDAEIGFVGVGDHGDGRNMLQLKPPSRDPEVLEANVRALVPTDGGDTPEAFECLFKVLGAQTYDVPTVLVLITDSIPHGMAYSGADDGCPFGVDWREELADLRAKLRNVYLVTCATDPEILRLQRDLVGDNALLKLQDFRRLTNLVMAICMDEVGDLDYFLNVIEQQRGTERRREILGLLGRAR